MRAHTVWVFGVAAISLMISSCQSHEAHLEEDAQSCRAMGHEPRSEAFWGCMKSLNERRCEQLGSRNPMCAGGAARPSGSQKL
jgi:hypothetical protein